MKKTKVIGSDDDGGGDIIMIMIMISRMVMAMIMTVSIYRLGKKRGYVTCSEAAD